MNVVVIYGSVRSERQGIKAARFLQKQLEARGHETALIDPLEFPLPFIDKMYKEYEAGTAPEMIEKVAQILKKADGFMIVTGEYNHGIPPALKNILDHYQTEYHYKPSAIACYSAGSFGGVRAAVHMRVVLGELGTPSIPTLFPISAVQDAFDDEGGAIEKAYEKRVIRFLEEFEWYMNALKKARENNLPK